MADDQQSPFKPPVILEERVDSLRVKLIGIQHGNGYYEEYHQQLEPEIIDAPALLLEGPMDSKNVFYDTVKDLAAKKNTPVYIVDYSSDVLFHLDMVQGIIGGLLSTHALQCLINPEQSTRRHFLRQLAKGLTGGLLVNGSFLGSSFFHKHAPIERSFDDLLAYGLIIDYRNIVIADNLVRLSNVMDIEDRVIPFFIGSAHLPGIHTYLHHPDLRRAKRLLYPINIFSNTAISKYEYSAGEWIKTEEI